MVNKPCESDIDMHRGNYVIIFSSNISILWPYDNSVLGIPLWPHFKIKAHCTIRTVHHATSMKIKCIYNTSHRPSVEISRLSLEKVNPVSSESSLSRACLSCENE